MFPHNEDLPTAVLCHPSVFDLNEAAMNLYSSLADLDELALVNNSKSIAINHIPNKGIGIAINDRLKRASN